MKQNDYIHRRDFLKLLGAGVFSTLFPAISSPVVKSTRRPNILFIIVDDLRPQLGCYGHRETLSPNIDRLAAKGTLFKRAYCQVPVCGPSRVSVLTGIRTNPDQWRCSDLNTEFITLPSYLQQFGYYTISNGKVFHYLQDRKEDWNEPPWRSVKIYPDKGDWAKYNTYKLWQNEQSRKYINPQSGRGPYCEWAEVSDDAYQDGKLAEKTIADLRRLKALDKPFFLACGFWRPHLPFNAPKKYWDLYQREKIEIAENRFPPKNLPPQCRSSREIDRYGKVAGRKNTEDFHREARHAYYACVSYVDAQIGKILKALDELELSDNTIVVLWGDHGWHLGEHEFWGKHNTLDNALRAPLIVRAPGHKQNNSTNALVEFVDIYPTLCELVGIPVPTHVQGTSFVPLLDNPQLPWKKAVFSYWKGCQAVKTDRFLYTEWRENGKIIARMLFDHQTDPNENENIAEKPENAKLVKSLSLLLKEAR